MWFFYKYKISKCQRPIKLITEGTRRIIKLVEKCIGQAEIL